MPRHSAVRCKKACQLRIWALLGREHRRAGFFLIQALQIYGQPSATSIIDDISAMRTALRQQLEQIDIRKVEQAASSEEALRLVQKNRYDLIVCDYYLGDNTDGQQLLEHMRGDRGVLLMIFCFHEQWWKGLLFGLATKAKLSYEARDRILAWQSPMSLLVRLVVWVVLFDFSFTLLLLPFVNGDIWQAGISFSVSRSPTVAPRWPASFPPASRKSSLPRSAVTNPCRACR